MKKTVVGVGEPDRSGIIPVSMSNGETDLYRFFCGSITFPHGQPGIILLCGQEVLQVGPPSKERTIIFEEKEFIELREAGILLKVFAKHYRCSCLFFRRAEENKPFIRDLFDNQNLYEHLNFYLVKSADNADFGHQLINEALRKNELIIPENSILAEQLSSANCETSDSDVDKLNSLRALRYLLAGIYDSPPYEYEADYDDYDYIPSASTCKHYVS